MCYLKATWDCTLTIRLILKVLVEGTHFKNDGMLTGRTDTLKRVVFEEEELPASLSAPKSDLVSIKPGDYVVVEVTSVSHSNLIAKPIARTTLQEFSRSPLCF